MKKNKSIIWFCIFLFILLLVYFKGQVAVQEYPELSSYNRKDNGTKVLYYLTQELNFNAKRYHKSAQSLKTINKHTMVIFDPIVDLIGKEKEAEQLGNFIEAGNSIIIISEKMDLLKYMFKLEGKRIEKDGGYTLGKGKLFILDNPDEYLNKTLYKVKPAVKFIRTLEKTGNKNVLFNEYYRGLGTEYGFWDSLGPVGRILWVQFIIASIVWASFGIRRFGRKITIASNYKRLENENMYARANILEKMKGHEIILKSYKERFIKDILNYFGISLGKESEEGILRLSTQDKLLVSLSVPDIMEELIRYNTQNPSLHKSYKLIKKMDDVRKIIK